uniref:DUF7797 domain-containing protein n=1 Tax=Fagus sylvatica TaxID=28930 RepID=A0A2N9IUK4_FAGSY
MKLDLFSEMMRIQGGSKSPTATEMELMAEGRTKLLPRPMLTLRSRSTSWVVWVALGCCGWCG